MTVPATRIVLHIGAEKTGTSSLQAALAMNAGRLLDESGLLYPRDPPLAAGNAHFGVAAAFLDPGRTEIFVPDGPRSPAEFQQALAGEIARRRPRIVVLSTEHFSSRFRRPQLEELARFLEPRAVEIIYYARRQDDMAASRFGTAMLYGRREWFDSKAVRPEWRLFDHCRILDEWAGVFGAARLRVRNYGDVADAGLVDDFLTQTGITPLAALAAAPRLNRAITIREAQFLYMLNQHLPTWAEALAGKGAEAYRAAERHRERLLALLRQITTLPESPPVTSLIGEADSAAIMSRFAESNAGLAEKYGVAFAASWKGPHMAARPQPLEPAVAELLAMKL